MGRHLDDSVDVDGFCLWMADSDTSVCILRRRCSSAFAGFGRSGSPVFGWSRLRLLDFLARHSVVACWLAIRWRHVARHSGGGMSCLMFPDHEPARSMGSLFLLLFTSSLPSQSLHVPVWARLGPIPFLQPDAFLGASLPSSVPSQSLHVPVWARHIGFRWVSRGKSVSDFERRRPTRRAPSIWIKLVGFC